MITLFKVAFQSLLNRKTSFVLSILSIALSVTLFLAVNVIKDGTKESFSNTVSQADLIVGARGSGLQLLLYTIFHLGSATNNISWQSYDAIKNLPNVAWTIPFSLGDSFHGFRVIATNENFYNYYRYLGDKKIELISGHMPNNIFETVIGSRVAETEKLKVGDKITLAHGISEQSIFKHDDKPFIVSGIIKETNTSIDRALYITLEGMEAIHIDWKDGIPSRQEKTKENIRKEDIQITQITSFLLRADNRINTLSLMRLINDYKKEPLLAAIPGSILSQFWETIAYAESAFQIILIFVVLIGILGMMISIYTSLESRRRELAILRSIGASAKAIVFLLIMESFIICFLGCLFGLIISYGSIYFLEPIVLNKFGILINHNGFKNFEYVYLLIIISFACLIGIIPALKAYRNSLTDGLSIKI
ncbi:ABC transporter permease [Pigmentibacter sp. JX0631]|uniref:ABC transporter permease n=1 Tax=Pigmentibacter sp. JX0631 TaxID=2976982 RepID=UPI0024699DC8|nr:FtsX-like permease family protein [Pigmentibacter sp. JX0631]WGL60163.1 ABC transporter permease [Pigmentibacter sp. JX0631]